MKRKKIILIILLIIILGTITTYAASDFLFNSADVKYDNSNGVQAETVQGAIDELYVLANRVKDECPNGKVCLDYICKRASTLHSENGITYGTIGTGNNLTAGEALDCKVSTSDDYTERFYYITDLETNSNYAVLLYYSNTYGGVADTSHYVAYYSSANENWHGPQTAASQLPTTSEWDNIKLSNTLRQLYSWDGSSSTYGTSTDNGNYELGIFDYTGKASRLLTYLELKTACPNAAANSVGSLDNCKYLMENTKYGNSSRSIYGYWLETPHSLYSNGVSLVHADSAGRYLSFNGASNAYGYGVRPAIEVPKKLIKLD